MSSQDILKQAYLQLEPWNNKGKLTNIVDFYVSKVLVSACLYLKYGYYREQGSVEQLEKIKV